LRSDKRDNNQLRKISVVKNVQLQSDGSCLISLGNTQVICAVRYENRVPSFLKGSGQGWITADYSMLPGSTNTRTGRNNINSGRSKEIQRLIGRSLRSVVNLKQLGENSLLIDCDVLNADGGTRTASIIGSVIALHNAIVKLQSSNTLPNNIDFHPIGAISVGILNSKVILDLNYEEDSQALADFNFVMDEFGNLIEVQGTGETGKFTKGELILATEIAEEAIKDIISIQKEYFDK
jgi:ribonuclease PH|tara:strand:+ start:381 stop:1088 length:708 start_codon:yes stop_codon:yes gene_type:complete